MRQSTAFQEKIDELNKQLNDIQSDFKYNKQSAQKISEQLQTAKRHLIALQRDTASLRYSIKLAKERNEMVQKEYSESREKYNTLYTDYSNVKGEVQKNEVQLKSLEEQLISQKETIESISKAFISLRKQLLTAKSNNKPLDPNKSSDINKIAKLLGHY
jgi:chromosome segregation ATPase